MKKALYAVIFCLCSLCNTAMAQSIMGKWYLHTKDTYKRTGMTLEFTQPNNVKFSLSMEDSDQWATYKKGVTITGKFSMDGKAMSMAFDKNSIKSFVNSEFNEEVKEVLKVLKVKKPQEYKKIMAGREALKAKELSRIKEVANVYTQLGAHIQILKFTDTEMRILDGEEFQSLTREESAEHDECRDYRSEIYAAKKRFVSTDYQSLFRDYIYPASLPGFTPEYPNDVIYDTVDVEPKIPDERLDVLRTIQIPYDLVQKGFHEKVGVALTVRKDGSVTDVEVIECSNYRVSSEVVKAVSKLRKVEAAKKNGRPVSYRWHLRIGI